MDIKTPVSEEASVKNETVTDKNTSVAGDGKKNEKKPKKAKEKQSKKDKDEGLTEEEKKLREEQRKRAARKKRKKLIKMLIVVLILLAIIGFVFLKFLEIRRREQAANNLVTYTVERRTITETLSATGTLQPADSYTVTSKVRGDIIAAYFEEGDEITKDDILYVIDSDDMDSTIRQREMSVEKAQKSLDDLIEKRDELSATSDLTGTVQKLYVEEGDTIQKGGIIADIVDSEYMLADIPFHASHADSMGIGSSVTLVIDGSGERIGGTVTEIAAITGTNAYGAPTKDVTVMVRNPGGISKETRAIGEYSSEMVSTDFGTFYYNVEEQLTAEYGGEIKTLAISEGSRVYDGQTIILFDGESLEDQIKDARDNLETAQMNYDDTIDTLGDYEIKAPITGTVVEKNFNVGESIDITGGNATVAIIYDLSSLTFDMAIDELDIFSIEKGQEVEVTSEAFDEIFYGEVTKISKVGTIANGTTTYPVTVTITDEAALAKLLPGMNIDAEVTVNRVENVIAVPTGAIARGGTVKVVKNPDALREWQAKQASENGGTRGNANTANGVQMPEGMPQRPDDVQMPGNISGTADKQVPGGINMPEGVQIPGGMPQMPNGTQAPDNTSDETSTTPTIDGNKIGQIPNIQAPAIYGSAPGDTEYEVVRVETGASDDDFIEIISGLEEGDIVIVEQNQASGMSSMMKMMSMGGMGAGAPAGGMAGANRGAMGGGMPR